MCDDFESNKNGGWVKLYRSLDDSPSSCRGFKYWAIQAWLIAHARYKDGAKTPKGQELKRGQLVIGWEYLAEKWGMFGQRRRKIIIDKDKNVFRWVKTGPAIHEVRRILSDLKQDGFLDYEDGKSGAGFGHVITILNFNKYQENENGDGAESGQNKGRIGAESGQNKGNIQECKNKRMKEMKEINAEIQKSVEGGCSAPPPPPSKTAKPKIYHITFDYVGDRVFHGITDQDRKTWGMAYPALNLDAELARAAAWLLASPSHHKTDHGAFLARWFAKSQDKGVNAYGNAIAASAGRSAAAVNPGDANDLAAYEQLASKYAGQQSAGAPVQNAPGDDRAPDGGAGDGSGAGELPGAGGWGNGHP